MSDDALWSARLVLSSGTPATLLSTETQRAICELVDSQAARIAALETALRYATGSGGVDFIARCREEVLKEREAIAAMAVDAGSDWAWFAAAIRNRGAPWLRCLVACDSPSKTHSESSDEGTHDASRVSRGAIPGSEATQGGRPVAGKALPVRK